MPLIYIIGLTSYMLFSTSQMSQVLAIISSQLFYYFSFYYSNITPMNLLEPTDVFKVTNFFVTYSINL